MMLRLKSPNLLAFIFLPLALFGAACYSTESRDRTPDLMSRKIVFLSFF
jgi:hypothetical protein